MLQALSSCKSSFSLLAAENIKDVSIWTQTASKNLDEEQIFEFVRLYNLSSYGGKATGEGGTPNWGIAFKFADSDKSASVNDFNGKLEVVRNGGSFYLENKDLYAFMEALSKAF